MSKTVLFQAVQLSISTQFRSIWLIDRTLSGAITPGQRGHESDGNEGVLYIPQNSSITGTSPSDYLVSYARHLLWGGGLITIPWLILDGRWFPHDVVANMLDRYCSEFKASHTIMFTFRQILWEKMSPLIPPAMT